MLNFEEYNKIKKKYEICPSSEHLQELTQFLDKNNIKKLKQNYRYIEDDITTWKYLDSVTFYDRKIKKSIIRDIMNPLFKYKEQ